METKTFFSRLEKAASLYPEKKVIMEGNEKEAFTYKELYDYITKINLGIEPGERVGIITSKPFDYITAILAIDRNEGVSVPINTAHDITTINQLISRRELSKIIADYKNISHISGNYYVRLNAEVISTERLRIVKDVNSERDYLKGRIKHIINLSRDIKKHYLVTEDVSKILYNWLKGEIKNQDKFEDPIMDELANGWKSELRYNPLLRNRLMSRFIPVGHEIKSLKLSFLKDKIVGKLPGYNYNKGDDLAIVLNSSGLESLPKGIRHSYRNLDAIMTNLENALNISKNDIILNTLPLDNILSLAITFSAIEKGATMIYPLNGFSFETSDCMEKNDPTIVVGNPHLFKNLISDLEEKEYFGKESKVASLFTKAPRKRLRMIVSGGGFLSEEAYNYFCKSIVNVLNVYDQTEGITHLNMHSDSRARIEPNKIGKPLKGIEHKLVDIWEDHSGRICGELAVKGSSLMIGYDENELDNKKVKNEFFRTGDIAYIDQGELYLLGRKDRRISFQDLSFFPEQMESEIQKLPYFNQVLVTPNYTKSRVMRKLQFNGFTVRLRPNSDLLPELSSHNFAHASRHLESAVKNSVERLFKDYPLRPKVTVKINIEIMNESPGHAVKYGLYMEKT